ncbi:MAG: hypothetical protein ACYSUC_01190 [Planctomycetota bacterium]
MMKKLLAFTLVLCTTQMAAGQISLKVCQADGETPFDCNDDIMVGTRLTLVISSDSNDYWSGGLFISGQDRAFGTLTGRDFDPNTRDWTGSHYQDAGDLARVTAWKDSSIWGFDLYTCYASYPVDNNSDSNSTAPGDWFIVDYQAQEVGQCNLGFYDYGTSWDDPNHYITFTHVPTRDLDSDDLVNFADFAVFASQWATTDCDDPNWCRGADLDRDSEVDYNDLGLFVEYWLWPPTGSDGNEPGEPDQTCPEDANVTYRIVDVNDSNEITIDVNQTVTLYVRMATTQENNVRTFNIEANISDTNLGAIDNRVYYPNDPNSSTARILAEPRLSWADYCGPGTIQPEGIKLFGTNLDAPISDGNLASFEFTCKEQGDVQLHLINWYTYNTDSEEVCPKLKSIIIHQEDPNSQQMMDMGTEELSTTTATTAEQTATTDQQDDGDAVLSFLEEIWLEDEAVRESIDEAQWNEFIESVENAY